MSPSALQPPAASDARFSSLLARMEAFAPSPSRSRALEAFRRTGLPHRRVEGWRWSDVRAALARPASSAPAAAPRDPFLALLSPLVFNEGVGPTAGAGQSSVEEALHHDAAPDVGALGWLAEALAGRVESHVIEAGSPRLALVFTGREADRFVHLRIRIPEGVCASVTESHLSEGGFSAVRIDYILGAGASLDRTVFQEGGPACVQGVIASVRLAAGARLRQCGLVLGAGLARLETAVVHEAEGAEAVIDGAYLLSEGRHADISTRVDHLAPGGSTSQLVRGGVRAGGRAAFQGRFHVARPAQKTDARMQHNALLLEEGAEVNAKPELEIYADDVQCAHGATTGSLDEAALFYMRQRGLPLARARAMLTLSFIASALDNAPADLRGPLLERAETWLAEG